MMKIFSRIILIAVLLAMAPVVYAAGWVSPTGNSDEEGGQWTNLPNAYDNPVQPNINYATSSPRLGWAGWADFTLADPIYCGRVRVDCDFGYSRVDKVQVDVWNTDTLAWETVYIGVVKDGEYSELTFTPCNLLKMRFRFNYIQADWQFWLYEVGFYESPPVITAPIVVTTVATSVDVASANLHGSLSDDGGEPCETWLEYGTVNYGDNTSKQSGYLTGQTFGAFLSGLSGTYHFHAVARNSGGTGYGDNLTFTVNTVPVTGWVSPTNSYTDPLPPIPNSGGWSRQTAVYDDEGLSGSTLTHTINDASPGPYLYLTHAVALNCDKIRFQAKKTPEITSINIWVLLNSVWTNVYPSGTFDDSAGGSVWNEVTFAAGSVTEAGVRFSVPANYGLNLILYEFDFHTVGVEHCYGFVDGAFSWANQ